MVLLLYETILSFVVVALIQTLMTRTTAMHSSTIIVQHYLRRISNHIDSTYRLLVKRDDNDDDDDDDDDESSNGEDDHDDDDDDRSSSSGNTKKTANNRSVGVALPGGGNTMQRQRRRFGFERSGSMAVLVCGEQMSKSSVHDCSGLLRPAAASPESAPVTVTATTSRRRNNILLSRSNSLPVSSPLPENRPSCTASFRTRGILKATTDLDIDNTDSGSAVPTASCSSPSISSSSVSVSAPMNKFDAVATTVEDSNNATNESEARDAYLLADDDDTIDSSSILISLTSDDNDEFGDDDCDNTEIDCTDKNISSSIVLNESLTFATDEDTVCYKAHHKSCSSSDDDDIYGETCKDKCGKTADDHSRVHHNDYSAVNRNFSASTSITADPSLSSSSSSVASSDSSVSSSGMINHVPAATLFATTMQLNNNNNSRSKLTRTCSASAVIMSTLPSIKDTTDHSYCDPSYNEASSSSSYKDQRKPRTPHTTGISSKNNYRGTSKLTKNSSYSSFQSVTESSGSSIATTKCQRRIIELNQRILQNHHKRTSTSTSSRRETSTFGAGGSMPSRAQSSRTLTGRQQHQHHCSHIHTAPSLQKMRSTMSLLSPSMKQRGMMSRNRSNMERGCLNRGNHGGAPLRSSSFHGRKLFS